MYVCMYPKILTGSEQGRQTREGLANNPFSIFKRQYLENGRRYVKVTIHD